jgi:hypothetical protein
MMNNRCKNRLGKPSAGQKFHKVQSIHPGQKFNKGCFSLLDFIWHSFCIGYFKENPTTEPQAGRRTIVIDSIFEGNKYRFCKTDRKSYWLGLSGRGGYYPGDNCVAPVCIWGALQDSAIEAGHSKDEFFTEKLEQKEKKTRVKKTKGPSISIF